MSSELVVLLAFAGMVALGCMFVFMMGVRRGRSSETRRLREEREDRSDPDGHLERDRQTSSGPAASVLDVVMRVMAVCIAVAMVAFLPALFVS